MSGWKECKIEELAEVGSSKRVFYKEYAPSGIPFYRSKEIIEKKEGKEIVNGLFIEEERYFKIKQKYGAPVEGDLLLSSVGHRSGIPYVVKDEGDFYFKDGNLIWLRNFDKELDSIFLYHWINSSIGQNSLESIMIGSAQKALTISGIKSLDISIPPLPEQKAIASVLSCLDDKIDLLHRQNKTLEAMAETLFRQWFVEEAEEGWEEGSLLELVELVGGGTPKTSIPDYWDGTIPWLSGKDISSNHKTFAIDTEKTITESGLNNSSTKFLPKYATVISARGTVGKYCLLAQPMAFSQTNYGILPRINDCFFFTYLMINNLVEELQASAYGCVFDTITTITFKESIVQIPSDAEIQEFEQSVSTYFQKIFQNNNQIRTLEKLRDTLLPKLMSGDVRIENTERFMEARS